jgi:hypothetical protein
MNATPEMAKTVRDDLLKLASEQKDTRPGRRWANELARAAGTITYVYNLENSDDE